MLKYEYLENKKKLFRSIKSIFIICEGPSFDEKKKNIGNKL